MSRVLAKSGLVRASVPADFSLIAPATKYYVDLDSGVNATAKAGDPSKPWKTIQGAIDQVVSDAVKGLVIIQQYTGNYSGENVTIKGDCSLTVEHFLKLPDVDVRRWDPTYPNAFFYGGTSDLMDNYYYSSERLLLGDFTLDSTWNTSNFCEGFNCNTITVNNDLTDNPSANQTGGSGAGMRLSHIFANTIVRGSVTWIDGYWDHVFTDGVFLNHAGVASTRINGYFNHCFCSSSGWNAETVSATFNSCYVNGDGFGYTDDFTGHCYDCFSAQANGRGWGGGSGGTMAGYMEGCKSPYGFCGNTSGVSGKIIDCFSPGTVANLGGAMSGYMRDVVLGGGYIPTISGTIEGGVFYVVGNTTTVTGLIYDATINIDQGRSIGGTGRTTTGGMRNCTIIQTAGGAVIPILVTGATSAALAFNVIDCTIITDQSYAIAGNAAGQYLVAYNNQSDAGTAVIDGTNFAAGANVDGANNNAVPTNTLKI